MRVLLRGVPWGAVAAAVAGGVVLLAVAAIAPGSWLGTQFLRFAFALLAGAAAFTLDEPAAAAVDATPRDLRARTVVRAAALSVPLAAGIAGLLAVDLRQQHTPVLGLLMELAGCLLVGFAGAAVVRRLQAAPGEPVAATVAVGIVGLVLADPLGRWVSIFPVSPDERWGRTVLLWAAVSTLSVLAVVRATRDPLQPKGAQVQGR